MFTRVVLVFTRVVLSFEKDIVHKVCGFLSGWILCCEGLSASQLFYIRLIYWKLLKFPIEILFIDVF